MKYTMKSALVVARWPGGRSELATFYMTNGEQSGQGARSFRRQTRMLFCRCDEFNSLNMFASQVSAWLDE